MIVKISGMHSLTLSQIVIPVRSMMSFRVVEIFSELSNYLGQKYNLQILKCFGPYKYLFDLKLIWLRFTTISWPVLEPNSDFSTYSPINYLITFAIAITVVYIFSPTIISKVVHSFRSFFWNFYLVLEYSFSNIVIN